MPNVYYSVGQNTTDHKTGTPTLTMSGGVATFSVAQTASNLGVGDRVTYDTSKIAYIASKTSTSVWNLVTATGGTPSNEASPVTVNSIAHEYSSLSAAEAGFTDASHINNSSLVSAGVVVYLPCYYDTGADTTSVNFSGYTSGASNYLVVYSPKNTSTECNADQHHDGKWKSTAYNVGTTGSITLLVDEDYDRFIDLQVYNDNSSGTCIHHRFQPSASDNRVIRCICKGVNAASKYGITNAAAGKVIIVDTLVYDCPNNFAVGIYQSGSGGTLIVYNCTVHNVQGQIYGISGSTTVVKNCVCQSQTDWCYAGTFDSASNYNLAEDATTTGGANDVTNKSVTFVNEGADDFHLDSSDTEAKDTGIDLSTDPDGYYSFSDDIDGDTRSGTWDRGCDEYVTAGAPDPPTLVSPADESTVYDWTPDLNWTGSGADYWHVQVDNNSTFSSPEAENSGVTGLPWTVSTQLADDYYNWRARGYGGGGWGDWATAWQFTVDAKPPAPTLNTPTDESTVYDSTPAMSFSAPTYGGTIDKYHIQIDDDIGFGSPAVDDNTVTSSPFTPGSPLSEGTYYWRMRAHSEDGDWSDWTSTWEFTIDANPPAPTLVSPTDESSTDDKTPTFDWNAPTWGGTVDKYHIQVDNNSDFTSPEEEDNTVVLTEHTSSALSDDYYYWRVRAHGQDGDWGDWSTTWHVTIDAVPPVPTLTSPADESETDDKTPDVAWSVGAFAGTIDYFDIQVDNDAGFGSPEVNTSAVTSPFTCPELSDDYYNWRVRSHADNGEQSDWTTAWQFTVDAIPPAPSLSSPADESETDDKTPDVAWSIGSFAGTIDYYHIIVDNDADFLSPEAEDSAVTSPWTIAPALDDDYYHWKIRAHADNGEYGPWSDTWEFTVDAIPPAPTLTTPADESTTATTTPDLAWSIGSFAGTIDRYEVLVDNTADFSSPEAQTSTQVTSPWTVTPDLQNWYFYWKIRAHADNGEWGPFSSTWHFTADVAPQAPTLVTPTDESTTNDDTPTLTWDQVGGDIDYHEVIVDNDADFLSPEASNVSVAAESWTVSPSLSDDYYNWKVRSHGTNDEWSDWSTVWQFTVDSTAVGVTRRKRYKKKLMLGI